MLGPWRYAVFIVIIALLGWGVYGVIMEKGKLSDDAEALRAELRALEEENRGIEKDLVYYEDPENLVKALKEQFNYHAPDEKLIILVSPVPTGSSTGTSLPDRQADTE